MTRYEFEGQLDRLRETYGDKHYAGERCNIIWDRTKHLSRAEFAESVTRLIANETYAPMWPKFKAVISEVETPRSNQVTGDDCQRCSNSGRISMWHTELKTDYAFRCTCQHGSIYSNFPTFKGQKEFIPFASRPKIEEYLGWRNL